MTLFTDAHRCASEGARPFASADDAWIWTMAALVARRDGAGPVVGFDAVARPCEPDDVVKCLDRLYRQRRIEQAHLRVLRIWGERQMMPPSAHHGALRLWREAIDRLRWPLQQRGIVATPTLSQLMVDGQVGRVVCGIDVAVARGNQKRPAVTTASTVVRG
ncbi:hypothetical protein HMPREF9946_04008 [Acetobacteraceae bacterium AT-5844]|nr:hypothetical protein HMPREF9946_04008 [Acetobacteraceae bacterium AT-5844]